MIYLVNTLEIKNNLPYKDYKFIETFDELRYGQDKNYGCFMLCEVKTTDKIRNDNLYSQCPMLVSKCKITDKNLSEYQLNQIKEKKEEIKILIIILNLKN